jgi:FkbM family methyltransferase
MRELNQIFYQSLCLIFLVNGLMFCRTSAIRLGSNYGGWTLPDHCITSNSICYCVGAGEDISFDLELIEKYGCKVFSFDPTPRAIQHIFDSKKLIEQKALAYSTNGYAYPQNPELFDNYFFHSLALWIDDSTIEFFAPQNPSHVSHSIVNLQKTSSNIVVPCKKLSSIMHDLGHAKLDLLKMDIEGAEYAILKKMFDEHIYPSILCVKFHPLHEHNVQKTINNILKNNYSIFNIHNNDYTFIYAKRFLFLEDINLLDDQCSNKDLRSNSTMTIYCILPELFQKDSVTTEKNAYELLQKNPLPCTCNYIAVPWAVLINTNRLKQLPSRQFNGGCTVCQHIQFEKIIPTLKKMGIQTLFTPHVCKGKKYEGISVLPFPHYAVNGIEPAVVKDIWYSFIGFDTHKTRRIIFNMPNEKNVYIKERTSWHFSTDKKRQEQEKQEYQDILARSRFSLCPRGTGASTLRFWESLQAGAIPVLIADDMALPEGVNWSECIIQIPENEVSKIKEIISTISLERENEMRSNCLRAYEEFSGQNFISPIRRVYCQTL